MPKYQHAKPFDIVRTIMDHKAAIQQLQVRQGGALDTWHYVGDSITGLGTSFGSGWANRGSPWANLAFRKVSPNSVEVMGAITVGSASSTVFQLPAGYIPVSQQSLIYFVVAGNTGSVANAPLLTVATTGIVSQSGISTPSASAAWVHSTISLDI